MAKVFGIDNKYQLIMLLIISLFVAVVALAVVFSKIEFKEKINGTVATVINDGDLVINYVDGDNISFNDDKEHKYGISITNSSSEKLYYSIYFSEVNTSKLNVKIKDNEGNVIKEVSEVKGLNKLINLYSVEPSKTVRYVFELSGDTRVNFKGTLKVVNESLSTETFSDLILLNNNVVVPKTRVGSEIAVLNEGLISTIDNKGTSYYFRGNVTNNFVKLGDLLFRIVRINGDGSVRLVLDGVLDSQYAYNTNVLSDGQQVYSLGLLGGSTINNTLKVWFDTNLIDYSTYISTADFCTDIIFNNQINGIKYSSTYERIFKDKAPDLYCNGNIYSSKIGMLSIDEVVLAGAYANVPNSSYYLYNKSIPGNYLTNSSYFINSSNNVAMLNVMSNGAIGDGVLVTNSAYIRPVINISISAKVRGSGLINDPYIIVS